MKHYDKKENLHDTFEESSFKYTPSISDKWSNYFVANTALGSLFFLSLELLGAFILVNYGFMSSFWAITTITLLLFLIATPLSFYAMKHNLDMSCLTQNSGFGVIGSLLVAFIYGSFHTIFFTLEVTIISQAISIYFNISLWLSYFFSFIGIFFIMFYAIRFIYQFQLWMQPVWLVVILTAFISILIKEPQTIVVLLGFEGLSSGSSSFDIFYFMTALTLLIPFLVQIGEQIDYLYFIPPLKRESKVQKWSSFFIEREGWIFFSFLKLLGGFLLASIVLFFGGDFIKAQMPIIMYSQAYKSLIPYAPLALFLALFLILFSQLKITTSHAYIGFRSWKYLFGKNGFSFFMGISLHIILSILIISIGIMEVILPLFKLFSIFIIAWFGVILSDILISKPLKLSPSIKELNNSSLIFINPTGVISFIVAILEGFIFFNNLYSFLIVFLTAFILVPIVGVFRIKNSIIKEYIEESSFYICSVCSKEYKSKDKNFCSLDEKHTCSFCCENDIFSYEATHKKIYNELKVIKRWMLKLFAKISSFKIPLRLFDFISLTSVIVFGTAVIGWVLYSFEIQNVNYKEIDGLQETFITFFIIIALFLSILVWWGLFMQESKSLVESDLEKHNRLLQEKQETILKQKKLVEKHKERLELALIGNSDGVWDWDLENNSIYFSKRFKEIVGYKNSEFANTLNDWKKIIHKEDIKDTFEGIEKNINKETDYFEGIFRMQHKNSNWIWVLARAKTQYKKGKALRIIGTLTDISEDRELQFKHSQQSQIIEQIQDLVVVIDLEGIIISWNRGAEMLLGYKPFEMVGEHIKTLYQEKDFRTIEANISFLEDNRAYHTELRIFKKFHQFLDVQFSFSLLKDDEGRKTGVIIYGQDITARKETEKELHRQKDILAYQAHHDSLTGLPNRVLFHERVAIAIEEAKFDNRHFALFFIDLDHFKQINDSLGHGVGDKVLNEVALRLKSSIRKDDTLARLGGDEFTILMNYLKKTEDASLLAQRILKSLSKPLYIDTHVLYISSSIGISLYPQDGKDMENLLMYADAAMYKAKDEGRNNFQFYSSEMTALAFEHVVLDASLRQALENEDFEVYYQPQMDARTDTIIGIEALVRWEHPDKSLVMPDKFIPMAEETGLIVFIDQWVMKSAMTQVAKWYNEGLNPGKLSLNLTIRQLHKKEFIGILDKTMKETNFKSEWLELEITEGQIMSNPEDAIAIMKEVSKMGVELAVDDFGTGYSSLSYLKKLPLDKLKIDKSFIQNLPEDEEDAGISKSVIALAQSLNLSVIAEGVETNEQKQFLMDNGCNFIQGYLYSKPMNKFDMEEFLRIKE